MSVRACPLAIVGFSSPVAAVLLVVPFGTVVTVFAGASLVAALEFEGMSGGAVAVAGSADFSCLPSFDLPELLAGWPFSLDLAPFSSTAFPLSLPMGAMLFDCVRAAADKPQASTRASRDKTFFIK